MEPAAIGPKMTKMAQKDSWMHWKMFSGYMMTPTTHGIIEGSKEDRPEEAKVKAEAKDKEKAEKEEDTSDQKQEKGEEKEERKAALTW